MAVLMNILIAHGRGWERLAIRIQCGEKKKNTETSSSTKWVDFVQNGENRQRIPL